MRRTRRNRKAFLPLVFFCTLPCLAVPGWGEVGDKEVEKEGLPPAAATLSKISEKRSLPDYTYDPIGKVDPFKSFVAEQESVEEKERKKPKTYLETLDLAQLELVAVVVNAKENYAMVQDAKGIGHVIKSGMAIGTNGGVVSRIRDGEVIVHEQFRDFRGEVQVREVKKKLPAIE